MFIQEAVCWLDKFKEYWSLDKSILTVLLNVDNLTYSIQHIRLNWSFKLLTLKQTTLCGKLYGNWATLNKTLHVDWTNMCYDELTR